MYFTFDTREYHIFDACRVISHKKNTPKHKIPPPFWETVPRAQKSDRHDPQKKPSFVIPIKNIFYKKKLVKKDNLWPQQWSEQSTTAYMGSQPPTR